jgi:hypothetical protein
MWNHQLANRKACLDLISALRADCGFEQDWKIPPNGHFPLAALPLLALLEM